MADLDQYPFLRDSEFVFGLYYILISDKYVTHINRQRTNTRSRKNTSNESTNLYFKGTLLREVLTNTDFGHKILCKHIEVDVLFPVSSKDLREITENVFELLVAIPNCKGRIDTFSQELRLAEGLEMEAGTEVVVNMPNMTGEMRGIIRYKGKVYDKDGIHFGIELYMADGRGNTNGTVSKQRYFQCETDGGIFLSLNRVRPLRSRTQSPVNAPRKSKQSRMSALTSHGKNFSQETCPTTLGISKEELTNLEIRHGSEVFIFTEVRGRESQEKGSVKFIGRLPGGGQGIYVGIDLDKAVGNGTGLYNGKHLFYTRQNHAALVPLSGVLPANTIQDSVHPAFQNSMFEGTDTPLMDTLDKRQKQYNSSPSPRNQKVDLATHLQKSFIQPNRGSHSSPGISGGRRGSPPENGRDSKLSPRRSPRQRDSPVNTIYPSGSFHRENHENSAHAKAHLGLGVSGRKPMHRGYPDNISDDDFGDDLYEAPTDKKEFLSRNNHRAESPSMDDLYRPISSFPGIPPPPVPPSNHKPRVNVSAPGALRTNRPLAEIVDFASINNELANDDRKLTELVGTMVEVSDKALRHDTEPGPTYGVIKYIGPLPKKNELYAGVDLERPIPDGTDGNYQGHQLFTCDYGRGLFVLLKFCKKDSRFSSPEAEFGTSTAMPSTSVPRDFGDFESPEIRGAVPPPQKISSSMVGKRKGIQGHHNSCYLDSTLFSLFAYSQVLDTILFRKSRPDDLPEYEETQRVLKDLIINPLRKNNYVRADNIMELRELLDKLGSVTGLVSEEKDPEEFLNTFLMQVFKAEPLHELRQGDSNAAHEGYFYQIFMERDENFGSPSTQQLLEKSLISADLKFRNVPVCLILQMPRFGKEYKMYKKLRPSLTLDITDLVEDIPRSCDICETFAEYECRDCFLERSVNEHILSYCKGCAERVHAHRKRKGHRFKAIKLPDEFRDHVSKATDRGLTINVERQTLDLFAVLCIATSHYVSFAKCGTGKDATWVFFDSMADRVGEQSGYNIPEITHCPEVEEWLGLEERTIDKEDEKLMPELKRRLLCDSYMCMYQSRELMFNK